MGYEKYDVANLCEEDELVHDLDNAITYVNEHGLYNILAQSDSRIARMWRRVIFDQLIEMRKSVGRTMQEQFAVWDRRIDDLYFDEESGKLMRSVTVPGGDVIQVSAE